MFSAKRILIAAASLGLAACAMTALPDRLDLRTTRATADGQFQVSIHPLVQVVPVNRIHAWEIEIKTPAGTPITGATIGFDGGMPQHMHGYPTQPRITAELGNGRYRLDGVKFSMTGWWEMKLQIRAGERSDQITFNTIVTEPAKG